MRIDLSVRRLYCGNSASRRAEAVSNRLALTLFTLLSTLVLAISAAAGTG